MTPALALLLLACGREDPDLIAQRDAITAWRAGVAALDAGRGEEARARFQEARKLRPRDALLLAWEARAASDQGHSDEAEALLREAVEMSPELHEARYALAVTLARAGRLGESGAELRRALEGGVSSLREARADPDFAAALGDPAFAFLPAAAIEVALSAPEGSVFWGSQATLDLVVDGVGAPAIALAAVGPVVLVSVVADQVGEGASARAQVVWTVLAVGAGAVEVGPGNVGEGSTLTEIPARRFEVVAPPDKPVVVASNVALPTPHAVGGGLATPGVVVSPGAIVVRHGPTQRVALVPEPVRPQRFEQRQHGTTEWSALRWVGLPAGVYEIVVRDPGGEVLREAAEVAAAPPG